MLNRIFIAKTDNFFCTLIIVFFIIFIFCNFFIIMQSSKKILSTNDRLRKFAFGNNGVDFTNDDLIKYQTLTCDFNILLYGIQSKPSFLSGQPSNCCTISSNFLLFLSRIAFLNSALASSLLSFIWLVNFVRYFSR